MIWTPRAVQLVKERYETDGPQKLAKELGTTHWAVTAKARRLRVGATRKTPPQNFKWTKAMITVLKERYVSEGGEPLAQEFGLFIDTVRKKASELGLHTIAGHAKAGRERAEASISSNIRYFDSWSPNMAYVLGFLFADGCVNKSRTSIHTLISTKDEAVLNFIRQEIQVKSKIIHYDEKIDKRGSHTKPQSLLAISSTILCKRLGELGLHPRKTYNNDPFPKVPNEIMGHFVRGYFDGDGSVCCYLNKKWPVCSISFVGSPKFIGGLRDTLVAFANLSDRKVSLRDGKTVEWSTVSWTTLQDLKRFYAFVYPPGHGFCLERKRDKLASWLASKGCL